MRTRDQFIIPAQAHDFYQLLALILVWCLALPTSFPCGGSLALGYLWNFVYTSRLDVHMSSMRLGNAGRLLRAEGKSDWRRAANAASGMRAAA
jgi:hypothetical protein